MPVTPVRCAPSSPIRRVAASPRRFVPGWRAARRLTQLAFLVLFLYLLRATEYSGADVLTAPVNLFFRLDPLNAAAAMLAGRTFLIAFWPALLTLLLTLIFGRFFCGWICPLGTLLDYFHRLLRPLTRRTNRFLTPRGNGWRNVRYWLLIFILLASALTVPVVGYLDPFGLLMRGWSMVVDPAWYQTVNTAGRHIDAAPAWSQDPLTRAYEFLRDHAAPFRQPLYLLAGLTAGIFAAIFALELVARRFWCRFLCPLGGMLGLAGRWSLVRRLPVKDCGKCPAVSTCAPRCRMGAFDSEDRFLVESCNLCMDCLADCPQGVARFKFRKPAPAPAPIGLSRRGFLTASALGVAVPLAIRAAGAALPKPDALPKTLLRPPGVADSLSDAAFLNLCIRCGECLKVCTTNGLQPAGLESGWAGLFSPTLVPRMGYCEFACTLCGQVCPTGAIPRLAPEVKAQAVMGLAAFDRALCLPWAKNEECLVCEEHCPIADKAIKFDLVRVVVDGQTIDLKRPYVVQERCIGCGICEYKCPLDGPAAILVYRKDAAPKEAPGMSPPATLPQRAGQPLAPSQEARHTTR